MKNPVKNNAALHVTEAFCLRCASTSQLVSGSLNPGFESCPSSIAVCLSLGILLYENGIKFVDICQAYMTSRFQINRRKTPLRNRVEHPWQDLEMFARVASQEHHRCGWL